MVQIIYKLRGLGTPALRTATCFPTTEISGVMTSRRQHVSSRKLSRFWGFHTVICLILTINHVTGHERYLILGQITSQNGWHCYMPADTELAEIGTVHPFVPFSGQPHAYFAHCC